MSKSSRFIGVDKLALGARPVMKRCSELYNSRCTGAGKYELMAVLTHKGRSADSGHYVAWVKQDDKQWIQFDDDELIPRKEVRSCTSGLPVATQ